MFATEFENTLNTTVITAFDESEGKCLFGICSNLSLIKDLSLFKDNRHMDTSSFFPPSTCLYYTHVLRILSGLGVPVTKTRSLNKI
jgi:hypothetical protein